MARIHRRKLLQLSGAGAVAAKAGGIASILATARAPAYAQSATVHWLRWNDFVPASDADADIAVLSNVVLPQLQAAAQKLHPLGGKVEIRQYGRTGKTLRPASIAFRITGQQDQQDQPGYGKGHQSRAYLIVPRGGVVTVTCGDGFDVTGQPKQPKNVSEEIGIQRREDVTIENVKKLIMRAIEEYRRDRDAPGARITTIT
jgi:hypothetical protein